MQHEHLLQQIVDYLKDVQSLKAVVPGGSYATGSQRPDSDIDLGLYYYEQQPLDIESIRKIASTLNDTPDPVVTGLGGWGTWVNGSAWLTIEGRHVDFLYRNIDFVSATIDDSNNGIIRSDYWQQPAYGFHSFMYCTETAINQPLYDPEHIIGQLKTKVAHYSLKLKQAIIKNFLWSARFTLGNTYKLAARGDIYFVTGCLARAIHCLVQVLYALNETYYISEKRLARDVDAFRIQPENFVQRIGAILGATGTTNIQLMESLAKIKALYSEVAALRDG
jgi:hypothetical protein